ncbi:preprotein translocase subunit SecG [Marinospirillum sp. MEB164]|uniref:Protein-export membrane protein SecG n=1 Tax=Marinospirillum alkalitolerans TaxID=3123374 RepID=A0ABW8PZI3_9GAMM
MHTVVLMIHVVLAVALVVLVLMQQGKGAEAGASFGGGASNTVFGSLGPLGFFGKATSWLAAGFFVTSLGLAYLAGKQHAPTIQTPAADIIEEFNRDRLPLLDDAFVLPQEPAVIEVPAAEAE